MNEQNTCAADTPIRCLNCENTDTAKKGEEPWRDCPCCGFTMSPIVPYVWRGRDKLFGDKDGRSTPAGDGDGTGSRLDRALIWQDRQRELAELAS